jgi:hypothetical protein
METLSTRVQAHPRFLNKINHLAPNEINHLAPNEINGLAHASYA